MDAFIQIATIVVGFITGGGIVQIFYHKETKRNKELQNESAESDLVRKEIDNFSLIIEKMGKEIERLSIRVEKFEEDCSFCQSHHKITKVNKPKPQNAMIPQVTRHYE